MVTNDDIEGIVVDFLQNSAPSSSSSRIEAALRSFIARLDDETHQRIIPGWVKSNKKRKCQRKQPIRELDKIEHGALAFLRQRQRERACENEELLPTVNREAVLGGIAALREGYAWNCKNKVETLWANKDESFTTSEQFKRSSPIERLGLLHTHATSSAHVNECKRRITALFIHHECKQKGVSTGKKAAEDLARMTGLPFTSAKDVDPTAQSWLRFMEVWGLGGLVIPGYGHKAAFERNLSIEQFQDLRDFCEKELPSITAKAESLHCTVARLLTQAMRIYEGDEEALRSGSGRLANVYRLYCERSSRDSGQRSVNTNIDLSISPGLDPNPLDTLAEVAGGHISHDSVARPYRCGTDSVLPSSVAGARTDSSANAQDQSHRSPLNPVVGARYEGTAAGQVQTPVSREAAPVRAATYGEAVQSGWQTYADQNCPQQPTTHQVPVNDAQNHPQFGFGLSRMTNGDGAMSSASENIPSHSTATNVNQQGLQPWTESDPAQMAFGFDPASWTRNANGSLNFAGHEGWFDLVNFGG